MSESKKITPSQKTRKGARKGSKESTKQKAVHHRSKGIWSLTSMKLRVSDLLSRRPHRSFRRTRRRDYVRPLKLPGYWAFTNYVRKTLWAKKKLFLAVMLIYGLLTAALVGVASQDTYTQLSDTLRTTGEQVFQGDWNSIGAAGLLVATGVTGAYNSTLTEAQQIYAVVLGLLTWLTTVWLLRALLAGRTPKFRDGAYNAGAPILPTFLVAVVVVVQLLPAAFAAIAFGAGISAGILNGGIESMLFWAMALLLVSLSLYWITSTVIALVVVTLPGMYPLQALKVAGDLVIGRRIRILLRLIWLFVFLALLWAIIVIPIILFDTWLKGVVPSVEWLPIIPLALLVMSVVTVLWSASYVYLLYRKVVDDDTAPA